MNLSSVTLVSMTSVEINRTIKAMKRCCEGIEYGDIVLITDKTPENLPEGFSVGKIDKINSVNEYSYKMIYELGNHVKTKYALIIQADGFILNPKFWSDEFFDYDYLGARWSLGQDTLYKNRLGIDCENAVGNGGFSLRSNRFLKEASKLEYDGHSPEDAFLCIKNYDTLVTRGIKFAPPKIADKFSTDPYNGQSFGFHGDKTIINKI